MRKHIAISFLFIYLFSATEFSQLLKLPLLIEHYTEHRQENSELSFLEFLHIHYFNGNPKDSDYEKDMKLPFKMQNVASSITLTLVDEQQFSDYLLNVFFYLPQNDFGLANDHFYSSAHLSCIWQPPRSC